jgi:hypothetical protein
LAAVFPAGLVQVFRSCVFCRSRACGKADKLCGASWPGTFCFLSVAGFGPPVASRVHRVSNQDGTFVQSSKEATMSTMNPFKFVGGMLLEIGAVIAVLAMLPALGAHDPFGSSAPTAAQGIDQDFFEPNSLRLYSEGDGREPLITQDRDARYDGYRSAAQRVVPTFSMPTRQPDFSRDAGPRERFEPLPPQPRERYVHEAQPVVRDFASEPRFASRTAFSDRGDLTPPSYAAPPVYSQRPYDAAEVAPAQLRNYRPTSAMPRHYDRSSPLRDSSYYERY